MDSWVLGAFFAPLTAFIIFGCIAFPIKWLIATYMKDGWLKDQILRERFESKCSESTRRVLEQAARCSRERAERVVGK